MNDTVIPILIPVVMVTVFIILVCCMLRLATKHMRLTTATTTTVVTQHPQQQPISQGGQYPPYQPVPAQPGYGGLPAYVGQPMPTGPYQGQPYPLVPPTSYQEAVGPGYPQSHAVSPIQPPAQTDFTHLASDNSSAQPAYYPPSVAPLKTGY